MKNTPTHLKRLLFERGITQRRLSDECGLSEANLNLVVNGKRTPSLVAALRIAYTLGVTVEELWGYLREDK